MHCIHLERELSPSSRIIDAFPKPPTFRAVERRFADHKRRSADSGQLLGTLEDVQSDDPIFILRRAVSYRNSTSRHRTSAPLDELALAHLHMNRESVSHSSASSDVASSFDDTKHRQPSRQEIIAAQRAASRANQRAILSAQTNSLRGVDVLLPGNAMIRSSRYEVGDKMRYSYVEPDGETYDISDIVEEEWRENNSANKNDLLEGVLVRNKDGLGEKLDRVLNKIKGGKCNPQASVSQSASGSTVGSASEYSTDEPANTDASSNSRSETPVFSGRTPTPTAASTQRANSPHPRTLSPVGTESKNTRATPPTSAPKPTAGSKRQPSIASVMSDLSGYATPLTTIPSMSPSGSPPQSNTPQPRRKRPYMDGDDFGVSQMMAVIEFVGTVPKLPKPPLDPVDAMLFGRDIDMGSLHPQVRNIYADAFKQLEDMDQVRLRTSGDWQAD